jgi:glycosyltransferase involved in cell wall biosynthesis
MLISLITAAHRPSFRYVEEAFESVRDQALPDGWELEWVIQVDGAEVSDLPRTLLADERVSVAAMRSSGPAIARNMALARSNGSLIKTLDADDRLLPEALHRDISVLAGDLTIGWTACRGLDLLPDGSVVSWEHQDPAGGRKPAGWVLEEWLTHEGRLPIMPASVCMRRALILAMGGWMALRSSEDTGLLVPASTIADGFFISTPGLLYRKHADQVTAQPHHIDVDQKKERYRIITERARTVAELWGSRVPWGPVSTEA